MAMWDWELVSYLRGRGISVMAPYSLSQVFTACRYTCRQTRAPRSSTLWSTRTAPGGTASPVGPDIPRRFYLVAKMSALSVIEGQGSALGVVKKSFEELGRRARRSPTRRPTRNGTEYRATCL